MSKPTSNALSNEIKYSVRNFCFHFAEAYYALHERGEISDEQLERVISLLDKMEDYPSELFQERLQKIFGEVVGLG